MQPQSSDPQKRRKSLANHEIVTMALTLCGVVACIFWITLLCPLAQGQRAADSPATAPRPLITQPVDESQRTTLSGNTYPLARPEFDVGTAPASLPMERMLLVLKRSPEKEFALRKLLDDQQDKGSPNYHQWLTPEEVGTQFGPTDADMQTITAWLQSHGFKVGSTKGRTVLEFSGSASQVQEAFHTTIHNYIVSGEQHWANDGDPSIPAALTPAVAGIDSLHNFPRKAMNRYVGQYSVKTHRLTSPAEPAYTAACGNGNECYFLTPYDFATIYDVQALWTSSIDGSGQTIAIVGRTDVYPQDATNFWQLFGLTIPANKLNIIYNGYPPEVNGDEPEADIDIQWSGAVAPQATIDFVTSESTETTDGVDLSAVYIVDNNLTPVMSESYGECELGLGTAGNQFYYTLWEQAAAQGISVFVSSGDNGSALRRSSRASTIWPERQRNRFDAVQCCHRRNGLQSIQHVVGVLEFGQQLNHTRIRQGLHSGDDLERLLHKQPRHHTGLRFHGRASLQQPADDRKGWGELDRRQRRPEQLCGQHTRCAWLMYAKLPQALMAARDGSTGRQQARSPRRFPVCQQWLPGQRLRDLRAG